ncbi:putative UGA2-succinate semialdehyde dehydrogenase [Ceraceosorus guamensis]|uniref:succinate-semialdehyde dehydrogenase [NAD(P)(+)] n=1 Tax=Ceraceosorus guamensis TaxID=1522189 RepID=A0A316W893_9BASI|nr:putative UGA2-succinate semialdehyde dehydrogenase [Ceraceosorus guamensis]PWN46130.1 putative UGA2-succinate semialdehyde dehydrogenase [Ceraceosorus guamensis]
MPSMPKGILKTGQTEKIDLKNEALFNTKGYIDGSWVSAKSGKTFEVFNKATHAKLADVPDMGKEDTAAAIQAAAAAFPDWSSKTAKERSQLLTKLFLALEENALDLAHIIVAENGKSLTEAKGEIGYSNSFIDWFAGEAQRAYGHTVAPTLPGVRQNIILRKPVGVVGLITPWNFPAAMVTRKLGPALAAGCTMVIKAPAETPFSSLAFGHLCEKVGIPKGVVNIVTCAKGETEAAVGKELCENDIVRKLSFTGSTRVGKLLMKQSADSLKKLSMELGGNAPFIVFDDADLDKAVAGAMACKFRGSGQTCICANRIYVHESVYSEFAKRFAAKVDELKFGYGMDEGVTHGPLVNQAGVDKVQQHVDKSVGAGAKVLVGGKKGEGFFFEATVLTDMPENCPMDTEETFGPLAALYKFTSEEDVIRKCNNVPVGLAGYFYSQDVSRCWRVADALQTGMVGINCPLISQAVVPFGGIKHSGFGVEGGKDGINEYLVNKLTVWGA